MRTITRQELMQDLLMTNVYIDYNNDYIDEDQIAYTYNNKDIKQFQIIINGRKLDNDYWFINGSGLSRDEVKRIVLEILVTHEIGHIHNLHIFEDYTKILNKLKWCLLKNKMSFNDFSILGDPHTIINIAEDIQVNSDYLSATLVDYANQVKLGLWIANTTPLANLTDYKINYKKTVPEYFQELANLIKSIKDKYEGSSSQDMREAVNEEMKRQNKVITQTEKDETISKDDTLEDIKEKLTNNKTDKNKTDKYKEKLKKDFPKLARDKNNINATQIIKDDSKDADPDSSNNSNSSNNSLTARTCQEYKNIDISRFLKKVVLTDYSKKDYRRDLFKLERRGLVPSNSSIIRTSYKTEYKQNVLKCLFIIDVSGSMNTESIRRAVINLRLELSKKFNKVDIIFYDTKAVLNIPLKKLTDTTKIPCGGCTDMIQAILENQDKYNTIIVYSDFSTDYKQIDKITCRNLYSIVVDKYITYCEGFSHYKDMNKAVLYI